MRFLLGAATGVLGCCVTFVTCYVAAFLISDFLLHQDRPPQLVMIAIAAMSLIVGLLLMIGTIVGIGPKKKA